MCNFSFVPDCMRFCLSFPLLGRFLESDSFRLLRFSYPLLLLLLLLIQKESGEMPW